MDLLSFKYDKYKLGNGLEVILCQDKSIPLVSVNIWYKAGSSNERRGKTGIAHLFEHMMFQGSENVPKENHFRYIQEAGGTLNGSTNFDRTNYYESVPSNFLEMVLWLEADRMGFLLPALTQEKLSNQIDVVRNERLERYDNQPYGLAWEKLLKNLYPEAHPYSWPTIGYIDDINSYTLDDVTQFFGKYYSPSNASLVITGDFEKERAKDLTDKYFGSLPKTNENTKLEVQPISLSENILIKEFDKVQLPRIYFAWHSDKIYGADDSRLEILAELLTGSKSSRLYKSLVFEKELAQDISAMQFSGSYGGIFLIVATAKPGIDVNSLKGKILLKLTECISKGFSLDEIQRAKNIIRSNFIYSLQNISSLANQLNYYNFYLGEPNSFNFDLERYQSLENSDIIDAAKKYLFNPNVELQILPSEEK